MNDPRLCAELKMKKKEKNILIAVYVVLVGDWNWSVESLGNAELDYLFYLFIA